MQEFQVFVFAGGKGSRITELTVRKPKCLLPIGNNPMVYYPLKMLEKSRFRDIFLVVLETDKSEVEFALEKTDLASNINVITIPADEDLGTADTLRFISSYITSDIIVVSCDLLTSVNIKRVLNLHRKHDASLTALYFRPTGESSNFVVPGIKSKTKRERDIIGTDPETSRLVFSASASDYTEMLPLKNAILNKHGCIHIDTKLVDAHFYIMNKWIVDYLAVERSVSTIKGELIPHILKKQLSSQNKMLVTNEFNFSDTVEEKMSDNVSLDIYSYAKNTPYDYLARSLSSYNDHCGDLLPVYNNDIIRCYAFFADTTEFGFRTNTMFDYYKANRIIMQHMNVFAGENFQPISLEAIIESTQLDRNNCFVGSGSKISSKTSIKSTTIGCNCTINQKTRLSDCLIMNNVVIKQGCTLINCILCDDAVVEDNCSLSNCLIGYGFAVPADSSGNKEIFAEDDNLMEV